jgi:hypothetical protein
MEITEGLVKKHLVAESFTVDIGYDRESEDNGTFTGEIQIDFYGRVVQKHSHRTEFHEVYKFLKSYHKLGPWKFMIIL